MYRIYIVLTAAFLLQNFSLYSQTGKLQGKITDAETHETLAGVTISVPGTNFKTISDMDGNFSLEKLNTGKYQIRISYISYETVSKTIEFKNSATENLKIEMKPVELNISKEAENIYLKDILSQNDNPGTI